MVSSIHSQKILFQETFVYCKMKFCHFVARIPKHHSYYDSSGAQPLIYQMLLTLNNFLCAIHTDPMIYPNFSQLSSRFQQFPFTNVFEMYPLQLNCAYPNDASPAPACIFENCRDIVEIKKKEKYIFRQRILMVIEATLQAFLYFSYTVGYTSQTF